MRTCIDTSEGAAEAAFSLPEPRPVTASVMQLEAIHQVMLRLESRWVAPLPEEPAYYEYNPLPTAMFLEGLNVALPHVTRRRFLDVGCGIGTKLALMHAFGWQVAGIERKREYLDAARELVPEAELVNADAFSIDRFDAGLVYSYRLIWDDKEQERLERNIIAGCDRGTVLFLPTRVLPEEWGLEVLGAHVWKVT